MLSGFLRLDGIQSQMKPESRSPIDFAVDPDIAAHQRNQLARDRKTKAGAVKAAIPLILDLIEFAKDVPDHVGGNADAGILDGDVKLLLAALALGDSDHAYKDVALLGELYGVPDQVGQHLSHPPAIAEIGRWQKHVVIHGDDQVVIHRGRLKQQYDIVNRALQIEGRALQRQPVCLDLGIIQHVVDHRQQRLGRGPDRFDEHPLFIGQFGLGQQFRHTHDAVHWRANLVAHVGEKSGLGAIRRLGPMPGRPQLGLGADRVGDIQRHGYRIAVTRTPVDQFDVLAIPEFDGTRLDGIAAPTPKHSLDPFGRTFVADINHPLRNGDLQHFSVSNAGPDADQTVKGLQVGAVRGDHHILGVENGETVLNGFDRIP